MYRYVFKRLLYLIPIMLGAIFFVYLIMYLSPGDATPFILGVNYTPEAAEALRAELGMDKPFLVQYANYVLNLLKGDLGTSYITGAPVIDQIMARMPNTVILMIGSVLVSTVLSIPIGIRAAIKPNSFFSAFTTGFALIGLSMPSFWLGMLLILWFAVQYPIFPPAGMDTLAGAVLPSLACGFYYVASTMRTTRSSMIDSINEDYIRTARAKGVSRRNVIYKHALKNALLPTITVIGMDVGSLLGGATVIETVFSIPGLGRLMVEALNTRDTPTLLACILITAGCVALSTLAVDIIYAFVDPRIKAQYARKKVG